MHIFNSEIADNCTACPPFDAEPMNGSLFRACENNPPERSDFQSFNEQDPPFDITKCQAWGLSVWLTVEAVEHARKAYKKKFRNLYISKGRVADKDGVILARAPKPG